MKYRQDYETTRNSAEYLAKYPEIFSDPRKLQNVDQLTWYNYTQKRLSLLLRKMIWSVLGWPVLILKHRK